MIVPCSLRSCGRASSGSPGLRVSVSPASLRQTQPLSVSPPPPPKPPRPHSEALRPSKGTHGKLAKRTREEAATRPHKRHHAPEEGDEAHLPRLPARQKGRSSFWELMRLAYDLRGRPHLNGVHFSTTITEDFSSAPSSQGTTFERDGRQR